MYAETFNVQSKWEEAAKWLRWAVGTLADRRAQDTDWNLRQFWKVLDADRAQAGTSRDWGDLLTMNAISQNTLAGLMDLGISDITKSKARTRFWSSIVHAMREKSWAAQVKVLQDIKARALDQASAYAREAQASYAKAGTQGPTQAASAAVVAATRKQTLQQDVQLQQGQLQAAGEGVNLNFGGIPFWLWAAGGVAVALLLTTGGPSLVALRSLRGAER